MTDLIIAQKAQGFMWSAIKISLGLSGMTLRAGRSASGQNKNNGLSTLGLLACEVTGSLSSPTKPTHTHQSDIVKPTLDVN